MNSPVIGPYLHELPIQGHDLIGREPLQACHNIIVGRPLILSQLLPAVLQRIHSHMLVETHLINSVLPFHLSVMLGCCRTNQMVDAPMAFQCQFKRGLVIRIIGNEPLDVWK